MSDKQRSRRATVLVGIAAAAGMVAGLVAVYVRESGNGNFGAADSAAAECEKAVAAAARLEPFATGAVAAFRVATAPERLAGLAFKGPDGADDSLAAFKGRVVLVNLWATWCVPCRAEMPALDRLQETMGGDAFAVVAVNVDTTAPARSKAFLEDIGVKSLTFYSDASMAIFNDLKKRGLALGLPTTLLLDGDGCRLGIVEGPAAWDSADAKALIGAALTPG